eukprot:NODE_81_length_22758_cov_0.877797.p11 type:complete len:240 gc:universal NODE_81_length_22758_cov_0.877797:9663-8944(-)
MSQSDSRLSTTSINTSFCAFAVDQEKRPCLVITFHLVPNGTPNQEVIDLVMDKIKLICEEPYSILIFYQPSEFNVLSMISFGHSIYSQSSREIRKNIKQVLIVHPPTIIQYALSAIYKMTSPKFKKKVRICSNLSELKDIVPQYVLSDEKIIAFNSTIDPNYQIHGVLYKKELIDLVKYDGGKDYFDISELLSLIPEPLSNLFLFLIEKGTLVKGIFRKSPHTKHVKQVQALLDQGYIN